MAEAFAKLMVDIHEKCYSAVGADLRSNHFWCLEINDILFANEAELKMVFTKLK